MRRVSYPVSKAHTMMARILMLLTLPLWLGCLEAPVLDEPDVSDMSDVEMTTCADDETLREIYCGDWECAPSMPIPQVQGCMYPMTIECGPCPPMIRCENHMCVLAPGSR